MIIVNLKGGLGNQMFQYALGHVLAAHSASAVACDLRFLRQFNHLRPHGYVPRQQELSGFGIDVKEPSAWSLTRTFMIDPSYTRRQRLAYLLDKMGVRVIYERQRTFESRVFRRRCSLIYLDGYWQSPQYFQAAPERVRALYPLSVENFDSLGLPRLGSKEVEEAICVNVRRRDFVGSKEHDCLPPDYYERGLEVISLKAPKAQRIYIFADDIDWCAKNFGAPRDVSFVRFPDCVHASVAYMNCMRQFKYFVIPNSTFAWWAAWLSNCGGKVVVAPRRWSGTLPESAIDIVPADWLTI